MVAETRSFAPVYHDGTPRQRRTTDEIIERVFASLEALPESSIKFGECRQLLVKCYRFLYHGELKLSEADAVATDKFTVAMDFATGRAIDLHLDQLALLHTSLDASQIKDLALYIRRGRHRLWPLFCLGLDDGFVGKRACRRAGAHGWSSGS